MNIVPLLQKLQTQIVINSSRNFPQNQVWCSESSRQDQRDWKHNLSTISVGEVVNTQISLVQRSPSFFLPLKADEVVMKEN